MPICPSRAPWGCAWLESAGEDLPWGWNAEPQAHDDPISAIVLPLRHGRSPKGPEGCPCEKTHFILSLSPSGFPGGGWECMAGDLKMALEILSPWLTSLCRPLPLSTAGLTGSRRPLKVQAGRHQGSTETSLLASAEQGTL